MPGRTAFAARESVQTKKCGKVHGINTNMGDKEETGTLSVLRKLARNPIGLQKTDGYKGICNRTTAVTTFIDATCSEPPEWCLSINTKSNTMLIWYRQDQDKPTIGDYWPCQPENITSSHGPPDCKVISIHLFDYMHQGKYSIENPPLQTKVRQQSPNDNGSPLPQQSSSTPSDTAFIDDAWKKFIQANHARHYARRAARRKEFGIPDSSVFDKSPLGQKNRLALQLQMGIPEKGISQFLSECKTIPKLNNTNKHTISKFTPDTIPKIAGGSCLACGGKHRKHTCR